MSLREEMARYEQLTGESAEPITINRLGAYLDGVDKGIEELEKLKAEFEEDKYILLNQTTAIKVIDNHIKELKGENK